MAKVKWRDCVIEATLLGFFMISACAFTALLEHPASPAHHAIAWPFARRMLIGVTMGATAIVLIYSPWGHRSGAHMNPAVTLCFLRLKSISLRNALLYIAAQFVGGVVGILGFRAVLHSVIANPAVNYVVTIPGSQGPFIAWFAEFAMALVMMVMVLGINQVPRLRRFTGCFAGLLVAVFITIEAPFSGMSINPARSLGSAIVANLFTGIWIYFTAPIAGMLVAVEIHCALARTPHHLCGKLTHSHKSPCIFTCNCLSAAGIKAA